jgi:hypothetical protein
MAPFDEWVEAFARHVEDKGPLPDIEEAERSAATTTNQDRKKVG